MGQLRLSELPFLGGCAQNNSGLQESSISNHRMTMGFGPFNLPIRSPLQKGWDHSPHKDCFKEVQLLVFTVSIFISSYTNWGWGSMGGVIIILTRGMGNPDCRCRLILVGHLQRLALRAQTPFGNRSNFMMANV